MGDRKAKWELERARARASKQQSHGREKGRGKRGMKTREKTEGIEDRLEAESRAQREPARPENATPPEDCAIAHPLVFYPLVVAFHPCARSRIASLSLREPILPYEQRIYKSVSSVSFVPLGSHRTRLVLSASTSPDTHIYIHVYAHARSIFCKTRDA